MTLTLSLVAVTVIATLLCLVLALVGVTFIVWGVGVFLFSTAWTGRVWSSDSVISVLTALAGVACLGGIPLVFGALT